jgi:hypothetical protein
MMPAMGTFLLALSMTLPGLTQADEPLGTIQGGAVRVGEHRVAIGLRGGASFLAGSQGAAYAPGPAGGLLLDVPFSEYAGFTMGLGYATHRVEDAGGLFDPDELQLDLDPANVTGSQHHYQVDIGLRFDLDMTDPTRYRPKRVTATPWLRMAMGASLTDSLLHLATTGGREPARTRRPHLLLCPGLGLSIDLPRLVTISPSFQAVSMFGLDHDEIANDETLRSVFRFQPSLDLLFRF